jgi:hypothetical protein
MIRARGLYTGTGRLKKGASYKLVVMADTNNDYVCQFHPQMKASLEIQVAK